MMNLFKKSAHPNTSATQAGVGLDMGRNNELYATDGPTGIRVVADSSNAVVDIVFVHGLTGNREKTWTHDNGIFWPAALLSEDFPCARIMTFGYDADVVRFWTIASSNRLDDHGKSLAYALLDQRGQVGQRPIIFIAHSLGGLVCEEALNLSSKRPDLESILSSSLGIIFMGSPHGGSYLARWGTTVANYVNTFRGTNREILNTLQPGASDLQRTEEDFQHMLRRDTIKLKVYCFYEALKMNDTVGKIVERESAILPAYENFSINANHRNMTKVTGRADVGYGQVRSVLERWMREYQGGRSEVDEPTGASKIDGSGCGEASYYGPVFNGPISGRYVIPGTHVTGGTANFNFPR
ncbi:uncharacterized protein BDR25DRAFT_276969 [Lindgomyces ingoldianus]|uniref:Uncharacterized protein n=1 Tax=Lindgomyces ingoldianus TaxID=673940 RepID=A0ACB6RD28_9PLEO|nr:uncharacterized protein BDR25DRAFT_276969 [Lindgomyces ingoldianus]KAF2477229.1 hypothetical protein BDR25DRAFT_276969 [Lindgomyces ingoldianus]